MTATSFFTLDTTIPGGTLNWATTSTVADYGNYTVNVLATFPSPYTYISIKFDAKIEIQKLCTPATIANLPDINIKYGIN
jgi:hypothetical protein